MTTQEDAPGAWDFGTVDIDDSDMNTRDSQESTHAVGETLNATVTVDTESLKKQLNKQIATREKQTQTTKKVPIIGLAMGIMGVAGTMFTQGRYLVAGALAVSAFAFIGLYEFYQVKELPPIIDEEMVVDTIERIIDELQTKE